MADQKRQDEAKPLSGRRALVTGASRGIGREIARTLCRAGAAVAINFREHEADAASLGAELESAGARVLTVRADVSRSAEVEAMAGAVIAEWGGIDILVNNAGIGTPATIQAVSEAEWDVTIDTNLKSAFLVTQAVLPGMRARRWGRLVFISSVAANVGGIVGPHYAASKAGLHGLMHYYAAHLAKEGITANVVAPALIDTEMIADNPKAKPEAVPVGRFGEATEVASAVRLLVENGYITGQTLHVSGGLYLT